MQTYCALSIVAPAGQKILKGLKTLEVRRWRPEQLPLKNLVIVENQHFLHQEGEEEMGQAIAIVDVREVHAWTEDEIEPAQASYWEAGYWAWTLENIRPIATIQPQIAKRKIYLIEMDHP